jgi:hypothetical protein
VAAYCRQSDLTALAVSGSEKLASRPENPTACGQKGKSMSVLTLKNVQNGHRSPDPVKSHFYEITGRIPLEQVVLLKNGGTCPWTNPRLTNFNSGIAKDIARSATTSRGKFHELNRGAVLVAESAKYDSSVGTIVIDFGPSSKKRGLADGGTTVTALSKVIEDGFEQTIEKDEQQFVNIRIMCGPYSDTEVEQLVEALNTNKQVDAFSIANYSGSFKWIKKILDDGKFPKVSYFDGDDGEYTIQEVIQILSLFALPVNPDDEGPGPTTAYVSKQKCLDIYKEETAAFERFSPVLLDLLEMSEYIPATIAPKYGDAGGRLRALDLIESKPSKLPYLNKTIKFTPHNAWVFPMLAALKPALNIQSNPVSWRVPVKELFDSVATVLFTRVKRTFVDGKALNYVGRNAELYEVLALTVEKAVNKMIAEGKIYKKSAAA